MSLLSPHSQRFRFLDHALMTVLVLGTTLLPLFYLPFTGDSLNVPKYLLLDSFVLLAFLLWFLRAIVSKELIIRKTILDIPFVLFVLVGCVSTLVSVAPRFSLAGSTSDFVLHLSILLPVVAWSWLLIQEIRALDRWRFILQMLLMSGSISALLFLIQDVQVAQPFLQYIRYSTLPSNTVSSLNSIFGIYLVALTVVSVGLLLSRGQRWWHYLLPTVSFLLFMGVFFAIGFSLLWWLLAGALTFLLACAFLFVQQLRMGMLALLVGIMTVALLCAILGSPAGLKKNIPVELTIGFPASLSIVKDTLLAGPKTFLFGSGPGTFFYDFSQYRDLSFNTNALVWRTRFYQPFNTILALLSEQGLLGILSITLIFLLIIGSWVSAWNSVRSQHGVEHAVQSLVDTLRKEKPFFVEVCSLAIAFLVMTVGFAVSFVDTVGWWSWWWFAVMTLIGLSFFSSQLVKKRVFPLRISAEYSLVLSLGVVLYVVCLIILLAFGMRVYLAEAAFYKATQALQPETAQEFLDTALRYRPTYAPYHTAQAQLHLQRARQESQKSQPDPASVAASLSQAVNEARIATDLYGSDAGTWEVLATMYLNARAFAPEATGWAVDALEQARRLEPTNPLVAVRLADIYMADQLFEKAEPLYIQAIELKPDYVPAYQQLALVYEKQQKTDQAIALFEQLVSRGIADAESMYTLGRLRFNRNQEGDTEQAIRLWERVVAQTPNHSNALYSLGLAYERKGDKNRAIQYYQRVRELNSDNEDVKQKIQRLLQ